MARASTMLLAVLGLALCALPALAARSPRDGLLNSIHADPMRAAGAGSWGNLGSLRAGLEGMVHHHRGGLDDRKIYFTTRYTVPPSERDDFEDAWMKFYEDCRDAKGLVMHDMKEVTTTNTYYYQYQEWESHGKLIDHLDSKRIDQWLDFVDDHGIRWEIHPLENHSQDIEEDQAKIQVERHRGKEDEKGNVHVLIHYDVPTGMDRDFIDTWHETAKQTIKEDGNRIYSLRRVMTSNTKFYAYGTWDTMRDYIDHFRSKHMGHLLGWAEDNDAVWFVAPLRMVGDEEERMGC